MKTIGILGGMGSYATCGIFQQLLDSFPAQKEWDRPRILIDNNCTMPSRVRAILYGEKQDQLIREMSDSVRHLSEAGAEKILLGCMTAHYFRKQLPCQEKIIDALTETRRTMEHYIPLHTEIFCLCTEGSIQTGIWTKALPNYKVKYPDASQMLRLRDFIEVVKQNHITEQARQTFVKDINTLSEQYVLLGCTELPVLLGTEQTGKDIIDPIACAINFLKENIEL